MDERYALGTLDHAWFGQYERVGSERLWNHLQ